MKKVVVYQSIGNESLSEEYQRMHEEMLAKFGIKNVTSSARAWRSSRDSYFIVLKDDYDDMIAGMRIEIGSPGNPMPLHKAVNQLIDRESHEALFEDYTNSCVAEICGLWSQRRTAKLGLGIIKLLKCSVVVAPYLGIKKIYGFGAAANVRLSKKLGFVQSHHIGDNGVFNYPSHKITSTVMHQDDLIKLNGADPIHRADMLNLRKRPMQERREQTKVGPILIRYDLFSELNVPQIVGQDMPYQNFVEKPEKLAIPKVLKGKAQSSKDDA